MHGDIKATLNSRMYRFYSNNIQHGKKLTVRHFSVEGIPRRTIYNIISCYHNELPPERKHGSGRKAKIFTEAKIVQLDQLFHNNSKVTIRHVAKKFKCSIGLVHKTLKQKISIRYRKKMTIPKRSEKQIAMAKTKCGRLYRKFSGHIFIQDDELYFTLSHSTINSNGGFYTNDVCTAPATVKFKTKKKFEEKVLVWITLGPKSLSKPLIMYSGLSINTERYLKLCIKYRLIPYIRCKYVFWPEMAAAHCLKVVLENLNAENINNVNKEDNPANVPEVRSIEDFWAYLKSLV